MPSTACGFHSEVQLSNSASADLRKDLQSSRGSVLLWTMAACYGALTVRVLGLGAWLGSSWKSLCLVRAGKDGRTHPSHS